jgi:hypothetical protein
MSRLRRKKRQPRIPFLAVVGGILILASALVLFFSGRNSPASSLSATSQPGRAPTLANSEIERVTLANAKAAHENQQAVFLDVRTASAYEVNHIAGAINIPLDDLPARLGELDPGDWIIPY